MSWIIDNPGISPVDRLPRSFQALQEIPSVVTQHSGYIRFGIVFDGSRQDVLIIRWIQNIGSGAGVNESDKKHGMLRSLRTRMEAMTIKE